MKTCFSNNNILLKFKYILPKIASNTFLILKSVLVAQLKIIGVKNQI